MIRRHCCQSPGQDRHSFRNFSEFTWEHQSITGVYPPDGQDLPVRADIEEPPRMSTSDRADLHRMATQIALSYARCHNETFDAFPALFQTAYHGLLSCTQSVQQEQALPAKKAVPPPRPAAQPKGVVQGKPKSPAELTAPAKSAATTTSTQRKSASGTGRGWPTWTGSTNKPGRPPKNGAGSKNGTGRYR
jgi:hypothetical protein